MIQFFSLTFGFQIHVMCAAHSNCESIMLRIRNTTASTVLQ